MSLCWRRCVIWHCLALASCLLQSDARSQEQRGLAAITVPQGFQVELACGPPLTGHPLMADFDDRGRLYVAESAGHNLEADELLKTTPNFIRRLEDRDGDGVFDRSTIFADKMTFPMGALWHAGALYVASPPHIWRLEDADDDGVAERREAIVGKFGFIGNAADIHGCFLGPNGRLYWCDGRHGHELLDQEGRLRSQGKAARIFSCRLDGSDVAAHCGGGMDNPVEIDFTPEGEMLGTVNLFYQQRGDCLVHWMHGGAYPRYDQEAMIAEFKRTGDLLGPVIDLGHVAVSGTTRYRGGQFGPDFESNFFVTQFNTHRIVRLKLEREGSTFRATSEPFWTSSDPDCHPTDVLEAADGSLLILDTGGWFRYGCPTSQIAKPEIQGAIYRVRREGAPSIEDPRGQQIAWAELKPADLTALLGDARQRVADRAIQELAARGEAAVSELSRALEPDRDVATRRNALWALTRIASPSALATIRKSLADSEPSIRLTAAASVSSTRDPAAGPILAEMVIADEPPIRREAATALGRIGDASHVPALLKGSETASDRLMEHAILFALIELNAAQATRAGLASHSPAIRRAALVALDQMDDQTLTDRDLSDALALDDSRLRQTILEIVTRRPGGPAPLIEQLSTWMKSDSLSDGEAAAAKGSLAVFLSDPSVQAIVAEALKDPGSRPARIALAAIGRSDLAEIPAPCRSGILNGLQFDDAEIRRAALAAIANRAAPFAGRLHEMVDDDSLEAGERLNAATALGRAKSELPPAGWTLLSGALASESDSLARLRLAEAVGLAKLNSAQLSELTTLLSRLGTLELARCLPAFATCSDEKVGARLLAALSESPALGTLSPAELQSALAGQSEGLREQATKLAGAPTDGQTSADLATLIESLPAGDAGRGRELFFGSKAACGACHQIAGQGAQIGPDLSKIGGIRTRRDLVESIALPSSSLARGYESFAVETSEGKSLLGVIRRETPEAVWLRTADRSEVRIARGEIEALEPSPQSIMPQGLMQLLSANERADLLAFLESLR